MSPVITDVSPPLSAERPLPLLHRKQMREGLCWYRKIPISAFGDDEKRFWADYKARPVAWAERGFMHGKEGGQWFVYQWMTADRRLTIQGQSRLARLFNPPQQQEFNLFTDDELQCPPLPAHLESKLFDYQIQPARQLLRALTKGEEEWGYSGAVDFSSVGLGKTFMDLAAALATGREIGVLCPPAGKSGWEAAFRHFNTEPRFFESYEAVRGDWRKDIVSLRGDGQFWWKRTENLILILDEAQSCRHETSVTFQVCNAAIRQRIPMIVASATIATNPIEMRFAGRITGLHNGGHYEWERFLSTHGCYQQGGTWKWSGKLEFLQKIHARLFPRRGCRVRKEDLGDMAPETVISLLRLEIPEADEIERQARDAEEWFVKLRRKGIAEGKLKFQRRAIYMALYQRLENVLVDPVAALVRADVAAGYSVPLFMNFNASRERMSRALGDAPGIYGGMSKGQRAQVSEDFQANRIHVLVNNAKAGGVSVNLHDIHGRPRRAYHFPSDFIINAEQSLGRVDRVGSQSVSEQWIVYAGGSVMESMVQRLRSKALGIATINDGAGAAARF